MPSGKNSKQTTKQRQEATNLWPQPIMRRVAVMWWCTNHRAHKNDSINYEVQTSEWYDGTQLARERRMVCSLNRETAWIQELTCDPNSSMLGVLVFSGLGCMIPGDVEASGTFWVGVWVCICLDGAMIGLIMDKEWVWVSGWRWKYRKQAAKAEKQWNTNKQSKTRKLWSKNMTGLITIITW